jgi:hypothetical protein
VRWLALLIATTTAFTCSAAAGAAAPRGYEPAAVSFVTPSSGWELAREGCGDCVIVRRTVDGGKTWRLLSKVPAAWLFGARGRGSSHAVVSDIAFANARDGYVFGPSLLATHDGGRTWRVAHVPSIESFGVGAGYAFALTDGSPRGGGVRDLWRSPVRRDAWRLVGQFAAPRGASLAVHGPVVAVLQDGDSGPGPVDPGGLWVSRTSWRRWQRYTSPCHPPVTGGAAAVGLTQGASGSWLVDCWDNLQSSQEQHTQHRLYETTNAGRSWHRLGDPADTGGPVELTATAAGAMFLAISGISDELHASFDGGKTWRRLFFSGGSFYGWSDLRFLDRRTGFVVGPTHYAPEHVYRTDDGGRHWRLIDRASA